MTEINHQILETCNASAIIRTEPVQTLWSGYGEIMRYFLKGGKYPTVIAKHIQLQDDKIHPKGWNTELSHQRKLTSYQVERRWYQHFASKTDNNCRVPESYLTLENGSSFLLIMEDLNQSGYPDRMHHNDVTLEAAKTCLGWLAHFHGKFMGSEGKGLWPVGTYWHLDTRPDELAKIRNTSLKMVAKDIDEQLNNATFKTLVHGDAKLANFCFGESNKIAAVDFQYVGRGCGMKDVAYFISSCFHEEDCEIYEQELLQQYFNVLEVSIDNHIDYQSLKREWEKLYKFAWADFYRFLDGWSPGHWKMHQYSQRITQEVIDELTNP